MTTPTTPPSVPGPAGYGPQAAALATQYESIAFADVHRDVLHLFPQRPSRVLDIGAGPEPVQSLFIEPARQQKAAI